jgi:dynein heavy chain 2
MAAPDLDQIAEVILYSEGYKHAQELGRKVVSLYSLSRELLSPQQHYDWGLRPLKTVLRACGHLLSVF